MTFVGGPPPKQTWGGFEIVERDLPPGVDAVFVSEAGIAIISMVDAPDHWRDTDNVKQWEGGVCSWTDGQFHLHQRGRAYIVPFDVAWVAYLTIQRIARATFDANELLLPKRSVEQALGV